MKHIRIIPILALSVALSISAYAQKLTHKNNGDYVFTTIKANPVTITKNQNETGTCWCFAGISFLESEAIKKGAPQDLDIAEMFVVSKSYQGRAVKYVRYDGHIKFAEGSDMGDVLTVFREYGLVPQSVMPGIQYNEKEHIHWELTEGLTGYIEAIAKNPNRKLSTAWLNGFNNIVKAYLGQAPSTFTVNGKEHTPKSYAQSLNLNPDDYILFTSFTHNPFYEKMVLDVPDNWRLTQYYNVPLDEMLEIMDYAIDNGYTVGWTADMSEKSWGDVATIPGMDASEVTQQVRQIAYDNKETTDDHAMHIYGVAKDQNGIKYYMVKNSWGVKAPYNGHNYASESYVRYKTMNILVNKAAVPAHIMKKLNIK